MQTKNPVLRKILSLAAYVTIACVVAFLVADRHPPTLAVGQIAPVDEKIIRFDGSQTSFRKLLTKPMVINFWATWCPPCRKELPILSKLSHQFRGKVVFVGAALNSDIEEIAALKKQFLITYELLSINDALADLWQARALPTTYLLDTTGKIAWAQAGIASEHELADAINAIVAARPR